MTRIRELVKRAHHDSPDVIIGKKGVTREVLKEIERRLENKEVVKVKMLRTVGKLEYVDRRTLARSIAESVGARLMGVRGRTFILYKPSRKRSAGLGRVNSPHYYSGRE